MHRMKFVGAGLNGLSLWSAVYNSLRDSSGRTPPAGASWPFVKLSVGGESIDFDMQYLHKSVRPSGVRVTLGKLGYLYFHSKDHTNDFGFSTLKIEALLHELRKQGYQLDESCRRNLTIAKITMFLSLVLGIASLLVVLGLTVTSAG
jgi:hypothetical protein